MKMAYTAAQKAAYARKMAKPKARRPAAKRPMVRRPAVKRTYKPRESNQNESIGSRIGGTVGKFVGHGLQQVVKSIFGFGDYNINNNTLLDGGLNPPEIINSTDKGGFIVRHREYIADINATTAFALQSYDINPGLVSSFPWLSQLAEGFEQYNMRGLVYEFKSMSSDSVLSSATSSALGTVIMATQYNSAASNFADKKTMENYEFANSSKPSCSFFHPVECAKRETPVDYLYTRTGAVPTGQDQRLYDLGNFQIATQGMQAASGVCGELWCTFEIEFYKPKLASALGTELLSDHFQITGTKDASHPLGTTSALVAGSNIGCTIASSTVLSFPSWITDGTYMLVWSVIGGSTACTAPAFTISASVSSLALFSSDASAAITVNPGDSVRTLYIVYTFKINQSGANAGVIPTITFGTAGTLPTAVTAGDLFINQLNGNIVT